MEVTTQQNDQQVEQQCVHDWIYDRSDVETRHDIYVCRCCGKEVATIY